MHSGKMDHSPLSEISPPSYKLQSFLFPLSFRIQSFFFFFDTSTMSLWLQIGFLWIVISHRSCRKARTFLSFLLLLLLLLL